MRAKKQLGQHFLHDQQILHRIQQVIAPKKQDYFVEIGPGHGALTAFILPHCEKLLAIEIDKDVIDGLIRRCSPLGDLSVLKQDALTVDFSRLFSDLSTYRLVGNLPYNVSTPLIFHVLAASQHVVDMHFMLQKEVVDRMVAPPGNKTYGRLSVMVQYAAKTDALFDVPPTAFNPPPKVDSAVVRLVPYQAKPIQAVDERQFAQVVSLAFQQRRKMLRASLKSYYTEDSLAKTSVDLTLRPEQLSVADFVHLSDDIILKKDFKGDLDASVY